jgi:hypothetical protein
MLSAIARRLFTVQVEDRHNRVLDQFRAEATRAQFLRG